MKKRNNFESFYLGLIILLMYLPIILIIIYSFNENKLSSIWSGFSLKWYEALFSNKKIFRALLNSVLLATISCFSAAIIGTLAAIGMPKLSLKGKDVLEYISTLPIMIPEIILAMGFLAFFTLIGIPFGLTSLIIGHTAFCIPYVYLMVKSRLVGIDKSLVEAAKDLGANDVQVFFDITLPLIMPAIISGMVLAFAMSFDDVVISIFLNSKNINTLPILIYSQIRTGVTPEINALSTVMILVTIVCLVVSRIFANIKSKHV